MLHPDSIFTPLRSPRLRNRIRDGFAVSLGALLMTATLPGRTHGLGLITKRVIDDLAIDTVTFAQLNFLATILGSLFCWPCGRWLDRFGQTRVATAVLVLLSLSLIAMSRAASLPFFAIGLIFTRGLGQSMLSIISLTWIGRWFGTRVGGAMGAFALLMSFMMAAATGLLASGVNGFGWRNAWSYQAIGILAVLIPLWLLPEPGRSTPHDSHDTAAAPPSTERAATWQSALRTPCFWVFSLSI
jgi:MFS family permease